MRCRRWAGAPAAPRGSPVSSNATAGTIRNRTVTNCSSAASRPNSPQRRTPHGSGLGRTRWVVERTLAWLHRFRRLAVRYERRPCVHEAFLSLACSLVCWYYLKPAI